ncbi:MAG: T9SS type A sorting domain-containing protein [Candidatus Marinimicrobia bacterium]|jgi:hypothetical protein|nr:T9SS type A sorting domain-containing protein [Candidatus Neomarinimicrobiota bacterium]MBT4252253.1 T9SS type A sorting domain-containing protein [Candidatus Neomarinimicrobiota bacterium]MBT4480121.1 T9SS type A sorting domain-containing protein [Candidatus Neomarinimicrobiota bacterium]MBT5236186.1 T9SS type A sorting domain-containing protein [Candidatus Neomarinimicrobiota bacterium]MBT5786993.1 T9SS type A sorting domain-containing protein [Candidatus Neomarinimicrobiota bacterium]
MKSKIILSLLFLIHFNYAVEDNQLWDGNQISNWWDNRGHIVTHVVTGDGGMEWPVGSGDSPVYAAGLWIVAGRVNGTEDIRSVAAEFTSEYIPGTWDSDYEQPEFKIYKIRVADGRSNPDWDIWPVDQGAPWIDADENGIYDPSIDSPDVKGDLFYWTVFNDGDENRHSYLWSTEPLGIEVKASMYGFEGPGPLENTLFMEWDINNAGTNQLDSVFLGIWQDIDLGSANNDYPGCAPDLDLSYHYVGELPDSDYGFFPPAIGFSILEGPIVSSVGDTAWVSGEAIPDFINLKATAFRAFHGASALLSDPENATEAFLLMNGMNFEGTYEINPITTEPDPLIFSGNPFTETGWLASTEYSDGDWRSLLSTGSFNLAPGESQHLAVSCVVSPGMDPLAALAALFDDVETIRDIYDTQFSNLDDLVLVSDIDVPHNTESSGPFTFQFEILDPANQWDSHSMSYQFDDIWTNTPMTDMGASVWQVELPDLQVANTATMAYYLVHSDGAGNVDHWPSGAPYNNNLFTFGPDLDSPVVAGLQEHNDVHYQLPFSKSVMIDTVYDLRADINDIWLNWTIGGSDIMTAPMVAIDSNEVEWLPSTVYAGEMADIVSQLGDTLKYWVTAQDASLNGNFGNSESRFLVARNYEIIGNWDHASSMSEIVNWAPFEFGQMFTFSNGSDHWGKTIQLILNTSDATADTMEMTRELNLSQFEAGWFKMRMATNFGDESTYGLIQIKTGGEYITIDSLSGYMLPDTLSYDLSSYLLDTAISLRFIAHRAQGFMQWILDDVMFHTDPNLVGIQIASVQPMTFSLQPNYPNPFNPSTSIAYTLPDLMDVEFEIFDIRGRLVKGWSLENQSRGEHKLFWDATNASGELVSTGVYLGIIKTEGYQSTIKMVLLR